jgi:hypothetical protein
MFTPSSYTSITAETFPEVTVEPSRVESSAYSTVNGDMIMYMGMVLCLAMMHTLRFW